MLIIYNDNGDIQFACSDDTYVKRYLEKHKELPFLNHGKNAVWLKNEPFPMDLNIQRIDITSKTLIKKNEKEIKAIELEKKNNIQKKTFVLKNVETVQTN